METLLTVTDLSVGFRQPPAGCREVLRGTALTMAEGEAVGLFGVSGGGKTTLARAIVGLLPAGAAVSGEIRFRGRDLLSAPPSELRRLRGAAISLIPQEPSVALNPVLRAGPQVAEVLAVHQSLPEAARNAQIRELFDRFFGVQARRIERSYPHELSGGEKQRVVILQAVCCRPALLIADEPASALDSITQREVLEFLRELRRQQPMALLFCSHNRAALRFLTDRCVELRDGRLAA